MSSDEEDVNPTKTQKSEAKQPAKVEENTDLDAEEYDDEEDTNIRDNDDAIVKQQTGITVTVDNPTVKDGGALSKKYTVYDVTGSDKNGSFSCKRRYNEFFELRKKLVENWPGYFIPPIPEKKNTGNMDQTFIKERQNMLNHFMMRCAKMQYIFYSDEMQLFIRHTGADLVKQIQSIKQLTPTKMYQRNKELFPEYDKELTDKLEKNVKKYFNSLEATLNFFKKFRGNAKALESGRGSFKKVKTTFLKYAVNDYKNKLKGDEVKKSTEDRYKEYRELEREDDLSEFLKNLKFLEQDLSSFFTIKDDLKTIKKTMEVIKKKQEEANKNLSKVRSQESEEVKEGLFKKTTTKTQKIAELENEIQECQSDIESLEKNRSFTFHLLNNHEFPILINDKRTTFAVGIKGFCSKRIKAIDQEIDLMKLMHEHYRQY